MVLKVVPGDFPMNRCVVVADDDPTVVSLVKLRLGLAQYDVVGTNDAVAAVAMVRAKMPAAVILDVQMPGGGGLSALGIIKSDPELGGLPVMMLTGERNAETVMQAMDSGADDYMVKPFHPDVLAQRVSRLVDRGAKAPAATWEL
jgi:DNA-binding response OmpR family regulator